MYGHCIYFEFLPYVFELLHIKSTALPLYIINFEEIAYHQDKVLYIIIAKYSLRLMIYTLRVMIYALRR